jgi:hypothetical protein
MPVFLSFETIFTSLTLAEGVGHPERTLSFFHLGKTIKYARISGFVALVKCLSAQKAYDHLPNWNLYLIRALIGARCSILLDSPRQAISRGRGTSKRTHLVL